MTEGGNPVILVTGASGRTGSSAVARLLALGARVRALVQPGDEDAASLDPAVERVEGDLDRPATLAPAMAGVAKVFMVVPGSPELVAREGNVIEAAVEAGVDHVVKLSGFGAAPDSPFTITRWHAESERRLAASGLACTVLRPNFFMQNFLVLFPTIATEGTIYGPMGEGRVAMVDCRDVGAVAAAVLTSPGHEGRTYDVTGPEALSFGEVAERMSAAVGREIRFVDLPVAEARQALLDQGSREPFADALVALFSSFGAGRASVVTSTVAEIGNVRPRTLADFLRESAAVLTAER